MKWIRLWIFSPYLFKIMHNMKKTAVVFGGNGLVGRELLGELFLNDAFATVKVVVRRQLTLQNPKLTQIVLKDFANLQEKKDLLSADDYFCCIGTTIKTAGSKEAFRQVDFDIPLTIGKLAHELSVSTLVVISSVGANARTGNFYLRTKGEMENAVRQAYTGNLKFVRPSLLMGNRIEYRFGEHLAVLFMKTFGWLFVGSAKKYRGIVARDVARAMIKATTLPVEKVFLESDELAAMASK